MSDFPECPGCKRYTKRHFNPGTLAEKLYKCPLTECQAPIGCHARIGVGVATLGSDCCYPEGHSGLHSYGYLQCNHHKDYCSTEHCLSCKIRITPENFAKNLPTRGVKESKKRTAIFCQSCVDEINEEIDELEEDNAAVNAFTDVLREQNIDVVPGSGVWMSTIIDALNNNRFGSDYQKWREWAVNFGVEDCLRRQKDFTSN